MAAAATDKVRKKKSLFQTTLNGGIGSGDASLTLQSASGLPTDTGVTIVINRVDANGAATPSLMEVVTGVVSGSTVGSLVRAEDGTSAKSHANASVVEMVWDAETWNDFVDAYLTEHNQDGTHKPAAISATIVTAAAKTTPVNADSFGIVDSEASNVLKELTFTNLKAFLKTYFDTLYSPISVAETLNPVGTIREFNVSTNPATLLGFGTWSAFGTGRVTVAIDAGQTEFDTNGETGGEKTHLLTGAESGIAAHAHTRRADGGAEYSMKTAGGAAGFGGGSTSFDTVTNTGTVAAANAASAHNNLQPYIVVYRWVRTA